MRTWVIPIAIAFGCSFLRNGESYKEEIRCVVLFMAGFACAASVWSPNFFWGVFD
jgi:hypothetical protein